MSDTAPTFLQKTETLLEALPYIQTFRGEMILVKFGGSAMESAAQMDSILKDVAFMWTVGMHPVVVHGGGKAISRALAAAGLGTQFVQGLRVTDAASMRVVSDVIRNQVNRDVVERLRALGVAAEPLSGDEVFHVYRKTGRDASTGAPVDWGFVGIPDACDTGPVREIVHRGAVPVLCPLGLGTQFVQGLRVTDEASIGVVADVIRNQVNRDVVERLRAFGVAAEPLSGDEVFHVHRKTGTDPATGEALDWGFVGVPDACDTGPVREIVHRGAVPVLCPLGLGDDGSLYNVNADHAAAALAKSLKPRKLAFVSDVPGLLRDPGDPDTLIHTLRASDAPALMESGVVGGGMLPKIQSCLDALRAGVRKVHIVDGRMPHSLLLEIYTQTGVGTEITAQ